MTRDRIDLKLIKDDKIRQALKAAQRDGVLNDADVERIIRAALADRAGGLSLDEQEVTDLLTIAKQSVTLSPAARNRIRQTILTEYTRHRIRDREMGQALRRVLAGGDLTREELEEVVRGALDKERDAQGRSVILSPAEIEDLLLLSKSVPDEFRRYILGVLLHNVRALPPPVTRPTPNAIQPPLRSRDNGGEYEVPVEILKDSTPLIAADPLPESDAEYEIRSLTYGRAPEQGGGATRLIFRGGGAKYQHQGGRVTSVIRWPRVLRIGIRIEYGLGARSDTKSGYGQGTTDDDFRRGTTTLGYHEDRHRQVLLQFLRTHRLPEFRGNVGQSLTEFDEHRKNYENALDRYFKNADAESGRLVDEVGYTRTEWLHHKF